MLIGSIGFQASRVDGFSMAPTLEDRDRLLVNKAAYAFSDPQPGDIVTSTTRRIRRASSSSG
jgi:Signal peptidase I